MIRAMLIAALAGAAAGALALWLLVAAPRIDAAEGRAAAATQQLEAANRSVNSCKLDLAGSEAALKNLREQARLREQTARLAMETAAEAARATGEAAQLILAERTPPGADACDAARAAFDAELRQERAK